MSESTTGQVVDQSVADNSSTTEATTNPAEQTAHEGDTSNSVDSSVQGVSAGDTSTEQNLESEALAKFAKGQGINDLSELSERELSLLKMARDNKSALDKQKQTQPKMTDVTREMGAAPEDATDVQKLAAKVQTMEINEKINSFFKDGRNSDMEPVMAQILAEKRQQFGDDYARGLSQDLPELYNIAVARKGANSTAAIDAARAEERNSMNKSLAAGAPAAHATNSAPAKPVKVTSEWIRNEYDPSNPEHRAMVDAATRKI